MSDISKESIFSDDDAFDDEGLFDANDNSVEEANNNSSWKVLIVDDEEDIHSVTRLALKNFIFKDKGLVFLNAYSGKEAREILSKESDIAIVLLDVVMETPHAGLDVAQWIREELKNTATRIVLRTGQPGEAPENSVISQYDINDYKEKSELTAKKLYTLMCASLRSYQDITALESSKLGLRKVIDATATLFKKKSFKQFATGTLEQLSSLLCVKDSAYFVNHSVVAHKSNSGWTILAGLEKYAALEGHDPEKEFDLDFDDFDDLFDQKNRFLVVKPDQLIAGFEMENKQRAVLILNGLVDQDPLHLSLAELFVQNMTGAYENIFLIEQMEATQKEIIYRLGQAAEKRSLETGNHVKRVAYISHLLALKYGLSEAEASLIKIASPLHDIGKICIPDDILHKPAKLSADEWNVMKRHADYGYEILKGSELPSIDLAAKIALNHHERWDGQGYPKGLKGEHINIAGRITAIADVFDALASDRCYKKSWPLDEVLSYFQTQSGKQFDPELVKLLIKHWDEFVAIRNKYLDS